MSRDPLPVLIVGAGPAGLATAGRLERARIPYLILEKEDRVAPAWHRHYERLHLHTVKGTSYLPFKELAPDDPRYLPRKRLVEYFEEYRREMGIQPRFGEEVERIERVEGEWVTRTTTGSEFRSSHVVIATGFNRVPHRPRWEGEKEFRGVVVHSREFRSGESFRGTNVLVVGMGNTGAEIALDLLEHGARPAISVRGPVNIVPRDVLGRPTQLTAMMLARLPQRIGDALGVLLRKLTVGDLSRWGIETPDLPPAAQLREQGKTPVIDVGTLAEIKAGRIAIRPGIERFVSNGVRFSDGREEPFDAVVLATGYRSRVEELVPAIEERLDPQGHPPPRSLDGELSGLHFVGFDGYSVGGLLRSIRRDSGAVVERIGASTGASAS